LFKKWRINTKGSKSVHVTFTTQREICPPGPCKQHATPLGICQVPRATPWKETYLAQTHFRKIETTKNYPFQNVFVTRTQAKTLNKQRTSHIYKNILKPIWT
jgi:hypothetical protein